MKKPYLNKEQRETLKFHRDIEFIYAGACLELHIAVKKLLREIEKEIKNLLMT